MASFIKHSDNHRSTLSQVLLYVLLLMNAFYTPMASFWGLEIVKVYQYLLLFVLIFFLLRDFGSAIYNKFIRWQIFLLVIISFSFFLFSDGSATTQYKCVAYTLLLSIPFITEKFDAKVVKVLLVCIILALWYSFYFNLTSMRLQSENAYGGGFYPLVTLPIGLYLLRDKKMKYKIIWSFFTMFLVLTSVKRGDILACCVGVFSYFFLVFKNKGKQGYLLFSMLIVVILGYLMFSYMLETSAVFQTRFDATKNGETSNRDIIYASLWSYFLYHETMIEQFLGGGFDATLMVGGIRAHSDFLELLLSNGILGLFSYIGCMVSLFKQRIRICENCKPILVMILAIWIVKSIFSMFLYDSSSLYLFMLAGIMMNPQSNEESQFPEQSRL